MHIFVEIKNTAITQIQIYTLQIGIEIAKENCIYLTGTSYTGTALDHAFQIVKIS